jgi:hypothetical protein
MGRQGAPRFDWQGDSFEREETPGAREPYMLDIGTDAAHTMFMKELHGQ